MLESADLPKLLHAEYDRRGVMPSALMAETVHRLCAILFKPGTFAGPAVAAPPAPAARLAGLRKHNHDWRGPRGIPPSAPHKWLWQDALKEWEQLRAAQRGAKKVPRKGKRGK